MSSELVPVEDAHLRISTAQRENALQVIRDAAADGRLDFDELDARTAGVMTAHTRGELAAGLGDLVPSAQLGEMVGAVAPVGEGPGYTWDQPLLVQNTSWWKRMVIEGDWTAPPFIEVITAAGEVKLDFTGARVAAPVIDLVVMANYGKVQLVVPEGWGVDVTSVLTAGQNSMLTTRVPSRPARGLPRIVVRGRTAGQLKVTTPAG